MCPETWQNIEDPPPLARSRPCRPPTRVSGPCWTLHHHSHGCERLVWTPLLTAGPANPKPKPGNLKHASRAGPHPQRNSCLCLCSCGRLLPLGSWSPGARGGHVRAECWETVTCWPSPPRLSYPCRPLKGPKLSPPGPAAPSCPPAARCLWACGHSGRGWAGETRLPGSGEELAVWPGLQKERLAWATFLPQGRPLQQLCCPEPPPPQGLCWPFPGWPLGVLSGSRASAQNKLR